MMTFDKGRERAHESTFAFDQDLALKVAVRRNTLLGRWAAVRMGLRDAAADAYVAALVEDEAVHIEPQSVVKRVAADLLARGTPVSRRELDAVLARLTTRARTDVVRSVLR